MKALSIEEKAKRFDEVIERARKVLLDCTPEEQHVVEYIFPELKESEDERIRKALIRFHKSTIDVDGIKGEDILAWLEKQGEQKETPCDKCKKEQPSHSCQDITELGRCALEMQDSQNLANSTKTCNIEPKFHEGEWVILIAGELSTTLQIVKVDTDKRLYWFNDNSHLPIVDEECLHRWTIQDAKDGDVLYCKSGRIEFIVILKDISKIGYINSYCRYNSSHGFGVDIPNVTSISNKPNPATKEQRDFLFSKMKEAGYEWDAEKKELKKIEQKPAWNEEDENIISDAEAWLDTLCDYLKDSSPEHIPDVRVIINKLKSLKSRVQSQPQPKQEWSEEDEKIVEGLNNCIDELEEVNGWRFTYVNDENVELCKIKNWLKFLKDRVGCEANCTTIKQWSREDEVMLKVFDSIIRYIVEVVDKEVF